MIDMIEEGGCGGGGEGFSADVTNESPRAA
jgi:hypothetical protein